MAENVIDTHHRWLLRQRRLRYQSMRATRFLLGRAGRHLPHTVKRWLARRHPRFAFLFREDRELIISDYLGSLKVHIDVESAIEREMLAGQYEAEVMDVLRQEVRPGSVCVDVGANVGGIALLLCQLAGHQGRVFCFEPGPRFFRRLEANLDLNPDLKRTASLHNLGVSDREGQLFWNEDPQFPGNAGMLIPAGLPVPVTTLDAFFERNPVPRLDLLKIDVEGMEGEVLSGAAQTLERYRPLILFETLLSFETVRGEKIREKTERWLHERGYLIEGVFSDGKRRPVSYPKLPANCLASPRK